MQTRRAGRRRVTRKQSDDWAVLAVPPSKLEARMYEKGYTYRTLAPVVGHESHSHLYRLCKGVTKTTSTRTADTLEAVLDVRGLFFARMSARTGNRVAA